LTKSHQRRPPLLRTAVAGDAKRIHELIERNQQQGRLLPRQLSELSAHFERFVVGVDGRGSIIACGELAPLSRARAEIRSLVVSEKRRGESLGRHVVEEIRRRASADGFDELCVFAHQPAYFVHLGFSIVPHTWLPEKLSADCWNCPLFRRCEQFALVADLEPSRERHPSTDSLHV
jgi:amino-acid N-acetyltransferase